MVQSEDLTVTGSIPLPLPLIAHHIPSILPPKCILYLFPLLHFLHHSLGSCLPVGHCGSTDGSSCLRDLSSPAYLPQWPCQLFSPSVWLSLLNSSPLPTTESLPFFPWFKKHFTRSFQFHASSWLPSQPPSVQASLQATLPYSSA